MDKKETDAAFLKERDINKERDREKGER